MRKIVMHGKAHIGRYITACICTAAIFSTLATFPVKTVQDASGIHGYSVFHTEVAMAGGKADTKTVAAAPKKLRTRKSITANITVPDSERNEHSERRRVKITKIQAEYAGKLYPGDIPDPRFVHVYEIYEDGTRKETEGRFALPEEPITKNEEIPVESGQLSCSLPLALEQPVSVTADADSLYEGKKADSFTIHAEYEDGTEREFTEESDILLTDDLSTIDTEYGEAELDSAVVPVSGVTLETDSELKEGDVLDDFLAVIEYEDGSSMEIPSGSLTEIEGNILEHGTNTITFTYDGFPYSAQVTARPLTCVEKELPFLEEEISNADYSHISDSIIATVTSVSDGDAFYYLSHVIVNEPSQICAGLSFNTYGGERETPTSASERLGWVIGTNGSNFRYEDGKPDMANVRIKNGEIMDDSLLQCNGMEICLLPDGTVFAPTQDMTAYDLLEMGVTDTWCCGDTVLIQNGQAVNEEIQSEQYRYPRTAFGMVKPCEYYIITAGDGGYEHGMTYTEVRDVLLENGCTFGKCMDGGGSSTLVFEGDIVNTPASDGERPVSDFLYFIEEGES